MRKDKHAKKKRGFISMILTALIISIFVLYASILFLWCAKGFMPARAFLLGLINANKETVSFVSQNTASISNHLYQGGMKQLERLVSSSKQDRDTASNALYNGLNTFLSEEQSANITDSSINALESIIIGLKKAWHLLLIALQVFFIKLFLLIASIPLFLLLGVIGLVDGLSQREIRRDSLGRESSYLFHKLASSIAAVIGFGLCVWVCLPVAIAPAWFFVPLGLLFSYMLSISASKFKKYL